jgi:hypothetical protein
MATGFAIPNLKGADGANVDGKSTSQYVLQSALSAYTDEAYTNAKKLVATGITGGNPQISTDTETFMGQMRWFKPLNPHINVASLTDPTDGTKTSYSSDYLRYIKSVRTHGAEKINMKEVVTRVDGLAKIARDFSETRAQDEHNAILSVLKGVAITEALYGASAASGATGLGGQTFDNDPTDKKYGFYVDLGGPMINKVGYEANGSTQNMAYQGAQRAEGFLNAFGMAFKDYEPEYAYLITAPQTMASFRSANLVDQTTVTEGNIDFNTIFNGKFRLIQTRAAQGLSATERGRINQGPGVDIVGTKTSFLVLPGALAFAPLSVPDQVEIHRDANKFRGGGLTSIWYRWGYVFAPAGYDWVGAEDEFTSDADYMAVKEAGTQKALATITDTTGAANTVGVWNRKFTSALSLGILPIFHT